MQPAPRATDGVLVEIEEEARQARDRLEPGFEERLSSIFDELSPDSARAASTVRDALSAAQRAADFDPRPPLASHLPGGRLVKGFVRLLIGWYVRFVVDQVSRFSRAVVGVLDATTDEVEALKASTVSSSLLTDVRVPPPVSRWWEDAVLQTLASEQAPVLHADCGDGTLLVRMGSSGLTCYGVEPSADLVARATDAGCEAQLGALDEHLSLVAEGSLGGIVLEGTVQWMAPGALQRLATLTGSRLRPGGSLAVISTSPSAWERVAGPVLSDLAPGRPLHPETWAVLLTSAGFEAPRLLVGPDENGPTEYAVIARRLPVS